MDSAGMCGEAPVMQCPREPTEHARETCALHLETTGGCRKDTHCQTVAGSPDGLSSRLVAICVCCVL